MTLQYRLNERPDGTEYITVFLPGNLLPPVDATHPNYDLIKAKALSGDDEGMVELFDISAALNKHLAPLSDRVVVRNGAVFWDDDEVTGPLASHVVRLVRDNRLEDAQAVVNFWENISQNPNPDSRENLLDWLQAEAFSITKDGLIIGYKGLNEDATTVHHGGAYVNGEWVNGAVPHSEGAVISMPRSKVQHDPSVGCSHGLHVGTHGYASSFGRSTWLVHVHPRDVVSVPYECGAAKMRTCRYKVVGPYNSTERLSDAVYGDEEDYYYDEYYDED